MAFLARELSADTCVNVMAQYRPAGKVSGGRFEAIDRGITRQEYDQAVQAARAAGLHRFA
jgi:putative pyruvate formate lyase activating enzyme